jgi:predicted ArsR family transcriptional regulator
VTTTSTTVSLLRWLRRQMREPTPTRERLEAAIANNDPSEARQLVKRMDFNDAQRRHLESLLSEWERETTD